MAHPISRALERTINDEKRKLYTIKLQELNEAKDKFFSIISHDLRSPFNSILGFTEILKEQNAELGKDELGQIIDSLYSSTRNIYNLVNNLLQYSKFQIGLIEFNLQPVSLKEVVKDNFAVLEGNASQKGIALINNIKEEIIVFAEKEMLNSIIRNLVTNAIKYTNSGGCVNVKAFAKNQYAYISVADSGIGIAEELLENLFKLDVKKSTKGTNKEEGTGLGLLLVKEFVEKHGGTITVKSEVGKGSEFTFNIKLYESNLSK